MKLTMRGLRLVLGLFLLVACSETDSAASPPTEQPVATTTVAAATPPAEKALTGRITYSYEGDIYSMDADGTDVTRLTTHPDADFDSVWSPDGTQIAFRSHRDGNEEVYIMNADGSGQRNLSNRAGGDYSPAWSPDGQWIAFMSDQGGNPNLWLIRPDGTDLRQLTDIPGISEYPSWSPDSSQLAFHCTFGRRLTNGTGDFEICVVNADGSGLIQLTDSEGESKLPAWSPDGTRIAFQSNRNGWPTLPDYVPPGYDAEDFGEHEIYVMNMDGSGQVNLTNHPREDDSFPAWSRDGRLIFSRYGCLMVMNSDGSDVTQISKGGCAGEDSGFFADWYQSQQ